MAPEAEARPERLARRGAVLTRSRWPDASSGHRPTGLETAECDGRQAAAHAYRRPVRLLPAGRRPPGPQRRSPRLPGSPTSPHHRGVAIPTPPYTPQEVEAATEGAAALLTEALNPSGPAEDALQLMVHTVGQLLENPEATFEQIAETWMGNQGQTPDQIRGWWYGW